MCVCVCVFVGKMWVCLFVGKNCVCFWECVCHAVCVHDMQNRQNPGKCAKMCKKVQLQRKKLG